MTTLASLLKYDVKYREFLPGKWMPSKLAPRAQHTWSDQSILEATNFKMLESDILLVTYPKSGEATYQCCIQKRLHFASKIKETQTLVCKGKKNICFCQLPRQAWEDLSQVRAYCHNFLLLREQKPWSSVLTNCLSFIQTLSTQVPHGLFLSWASFLAPRTLRQDWT